MAGRQALDSWIREILTDENLKKQYGKCTRLALVHVAGKDQEVYTVSLPGKQWDPKELATLFREKAQDHCSELPGHQTYNVLAFFEDRNEPSARRAFGEQGGNNVEEPEYLTEGPTAKGLVAQAMRHNETLAKIYTVQTASMTDACIRMVDRLSNALDRNTTENREMFTLLRESAMAQVTQNNEHELKRIKIQSTEDMKASLTKLLPALVNGVTGKEIFPQSMEDSSILEEMASELSEQDLMLLQQTLKPRLMAILAKRMTRINETKQKAKQDVERAVLSNGVDIEDAELSSAKETVQ